MVLRQPPFLNSNLCLQLKKIYLAVLIFCLADILLFVFAVWPLVKQIKASADNLINQKTKLVVLESQSAGLDSFQQNLTDLKNYTQLVQSAFVEPSAPVRFLEFLENQTQAHQLKMSAMPFDVPSVRGDIWSSVGVRLELEGKTADCLRFAEMLENSQWILTVTRFDLRKFKPQGGEISSGQVPEAVLSMELNVPSGKAPSKKN